MVLPVKDGVYGVQAGHSPVLVAIHMGMLKFTVDGEPREILVGDGIAEVTPIFVLLLVDSAERPRTSTRTVPRLPASAPKSACSISRACTSITRPRSLWTAPCSVCRLLRSISVKTSYLNDISPFFSINKGPALAAPAAGQALFLRSALDSGITK